MMVLTADLIKRSEENAVKSGIASFKELMLRAGKAAAEIIDRKYQCNGKSVTVLCGRGNNGGDGFVIAEELSRRGASVKVVTPFGPPVTEIAAFYADSIILSEKCEAFQPEDSEIIIDALFGIGLNRQLNSEAQEIIRLINSADGVKIAVDLPSGIEADTGKALGAAVHADLTVTFTAPKPCFFLSDGIDAVGEAVIANIGIEPTDFAFKTTEMPFFEKRRKNTHKGTYGTALNICGSYGMAGAAILSAKAALRSGVGILKAVICEKIYAPFTACVPEAVCIPARQRKSGALAASEIDAEELLKGVDSVLIGCGLGNNDETLAILKKILNRANIPVVIDADGINALCRSIDIIKNTRASVILTPHPAEMSRLCGLSVAEIEANRISVARSFAEKYGCTLVLKGAFTVTALKNGEVFVNTTGNAGMATGGSGDVLSGIIVSLLAQGMPPEKAVPSAVYLHGEAGDRAAAEKGERAMLPSDIIEEL